MGGTSKLMLEITSRNRQLREQLDAALASIDHLRKENRALRTHAIGTENGRALIAALGQQRIKAIARRAS
jgi:hypothetical protein